MSAARISTDITNLLGEYQPTYDLLSEQERQYRYLATKERIEALPEGSTTAFKALPVQSQQLGIGWTSNVSYQLEKHKELQDRYNFPEREEKAEKEARN
jgi:hypothetical protein